MFGNGVPQLGWDTGKPQCKRAVSLRRDDVLQLLVGKENINSVVQLLVQQYLKKARCLHHDRGLEHVVSLDNDVDHTRGAEALIGTLKT